MTADVVGLLMWRAEGTLEMVTPAGEAFLDMARRAGACLGRSSVSMLAVPCMPWAWTRQPGLRECDFRARPSVRYAARLGMDTWRIWRASDRKYFVVQRVPGCVPGVCG